MKKIKIDYLVPLLVTHENKEYICFIDYSRDKVHFLSGVDEKIKLEIHNLILNEVNSANLLDIKNPDIINNPRITQVISDIDNDIIRQKFSGCIKDEEDERN